MGRNGVYSWAISVLDVDSTSWLLCHKYLQFVMAVSLMGSFLVSFNTDSTEWLAILLRNFFANYWLYHIIISERKATLLLVDFSYTASSLFWH